MDSSFFSRRFLPFVALLAALALGYLSFDWAVGAVVHNRKVVAVPDVTGKSAFEALNQLAGVHLGLAKEGDQFDKRYPAGTIIRQIPPAGMSVREGRTIRIVLSQGGETLFVPDVVGQPVRNAQALLQNAGLNVGEMEHRPSLRYEKDQVMATDPPANATVAKNSMVGMVVSDGPPAGDVMLTPDFVGRALSDVKSWAASHQVTLSIKEDSDPLKPAGAVTMQSPTADTPLRSGDSLTVVANTGGGSQGPHVRFEIPSGSGDRDVKIIVVDESGEHEVYRKAHSPGSVIDLPVTAKGRARARIFLNAIMVEEQEIQ